MDNLKLESGRCTHILHGPLQLARRLETSASISSEVVPKYAQESSCVVDGLRNHYLGRTCGTLKQHTRVFRLVSEVIGALPEQQQDKSWQETALAKQVNLSADLPMRSQGFILNASTCHIFLFLFCFEKT